MNKVLILYLQSLGFEQEFLNDGSGFWMNKPIENDLLGHCSINIEEMEDDIHIFVFIEGVKAPSEDIMHLTYTKKTLDNVIALLEFRNDR